MKLYFQARILDHLDIDTNVVTGNAALYLEKRGQLELAAVLYDRAKVNALSSHWDRIPRSLFVEITTSVYNLQ